MFLESVDLWKKLYSISYSILIVCVIYIKFAFIGNILYTLTVGRQVYGRPDNEGADMARRY